MHTTFIAVVFASLATALPADVIAAGTSTCSAASTLTSVISTCGGASYCSSVLDPLTATVTASLTSTTKKTTTSTITSVITGKTTKTSTKIVTSTAPPSTLTKTVTVYPKTVTKTRNTQPYQLCYPASSSKAKRNPAATSCVNTYGPASITAACSCFGVTASTTTHTVTASLATTTVVHTYNVTKTSTSTPITTKTTTSTTTPHTTITKTVSKISTTTTTVTATNSILGGPAFTLLASSSNTPADSLSLSIQSQTSVIFANSSFASAFGLMPGSNELFSAYYMLSLEVDDDTLNAVMVGEGSSALICSIDGTTCALSCAAGSTGGQFCVNQDATSDGGVYQLFFGECGASGGEEYEQVYLTAVQQDE